MHIYYWVIIIFKIGDLVSRKSYNNDIVFKIVSIDNNIVKLIGVNVRLMADSDINDLIMANDNVDDKDIIERNISNFDRANYFYLPGKILHIDGDQEYLDRCLKYYNNLNLMAMGICDEEENISNNIVEYLEEYNPNILIITGHDAYYSKKGSAMDINNYKNSKNFVKAVKEAKIGRAHV